MGEVHLQCRQNRTAAHLPAMGARQFKCSAGSGSGKIGRGEGQIASARRIPYERAAILAV